MADSGDNAALENLISLMKKKKEVTRAAAQRDIDRTEMDYGFDEDGNPVFDAWKLDMKAYRAAHPELGRRQARRQAPKMWEEGMDPALRGKQISEGNPFSKLHQLRDTYANLKSGDVNDFAGEGQLYAGSFLNQRDWRAKDETQQNYNLKQDYEDRINQLEDVKEGAKMDLGLGIAGLRYDQARAQAMSQPLSVAPPEMRMSAPSQGQSTSQQAIGPQLPNGLMTNALRMTSGGVQGVYAPRVQQPRFRLPGTGLLEIMR